MTSQWQSRELQNAWDGGWRFALLAYSDGRNAAHVPARENGYRCEIVFQPGADWRSGTWAASGCDTLKTLGLVLGDRGTYVARDLQPTFLPRLMPDGVFLAEVEVGAGLFLIRVGSRCLWFERSAA